DGANATQLFSASGNLDADYGVDWSPDGTTILFTRRDSITDNGDLFTVPATGGPLMRLTTDPHRNQWATWGALASFELAVTLSGSGGGTVTSSSGGISCGVTCTAPFGDPASVSLTATPAAGSTFAGWTGDCSGTGACTLSMT